MKTSLACRCADRKGDGLGFIIWDREAHPWFRSSALTMVKIGAVVIQFRRNGTESAEGRDITARATRKQGRSTAPGAPPSVQNRKSRGLRDDARETPDRQAGDTPLLTLGAERAIEALPGDFSTPVPAGALRPGHQQISRVVGG